MTNFRTKMRAKGSSFSFTNSTTGMRFQISFKLRVLIFSTIAKVFRHFFVILMFALNTNPIEDKL